MIVVELGNVKQIETKSLAKNYWCKWTLRWWWETETGQEGHEARREKIKITPKTVSWSKYIQKKINTKQMKC